MPNDFTYLPQQPVPHTSLQSSALPPLRRHTRPPAPAPAPALTHSYSSSPPHPPSHLSSSGSVPPPPLFPVPSVPGGYGPSNPSGLVPLPSRPMTERATTTNAHNVQVMGYQNVSTPGISHQRSATVSWSHRACIVYGVPANYAQRSTLDANKDDGSSSYGNQTFERSPDMTGNMNDYARERGITPFPFAGTGHISECLTFIFTLAKRHLCLGQQTSAPQPDLPCKLCSSPTRSNEHTRFGGFCSEKHKWDWSAVILTLPHAASTTECCALRLIRDSRPNQNQSRRMP